MQVILQYFRLINYGEPKVKASICIARQLNKGKYFAHCIREWEKLIKKGERIPISKRGKHQKIRSLLDDEDIKLQVASYLRVNVLCR